ncbi:hypothetical protein B0E45_20610 [Sinorhizobium sp. A49]|nr:hypothetical protein B0E45_20610 [Sinorhizobium sp. A49]
MLLPCLSFKRKRRSGSGVASPGASFAAFDDMPAGERRKVLKRCRDVLDGGYDSGLASLCRLLQSSASR